MMDLRRLAGVSIRLSWASGRAARVRFVLIAFGPAIAALLILSTVTVYSGVAAWSAKTRDRQGVADPVPSRHLRDVTVVWDTTTQFRGKPVLIRVFQSFGHGPSPPGVDSPPTPGTAFVSPALQGMLAAPGGHILKERLPGSITGTIDEPGLLTPGEAVAYVGRPASHDAPPGYRLRLDQGLVVTTFVAPSSDRLGLQLILALAVIALMIPIGVLIATTARLSATARFERVAALRLLGSSIRELRWMFGVESGALAGIGCVVGIAIFTGGRALLLRAPFVENTWFVSTLVFPMALAVLCVVLMPIVGGVSGMLGVRRITRSPVATALGAGDPPKGGLWPALLAIGLVSLLLCAAFGKSVRAMSAPLPGILIGGSLVLTLVGLAGVSPWLARRSSGMLARRFGTSIQLAARRLQAGGSSSSRAVAAVTVFLGLAIVLQGFARLGDEDQGETAGPPIQANELAVFELPLLARVLTAVDGVVSVRLDDSCQKRYPCRAVVVTDGSASTIDRVRTVVGWRGTVLTPEEVLEPPRDEGVTPIILRMMTVVTWLVLFVTAMAILVSVVDSVVERRAAFATLTALGVGSSFARRSVAAEIAIPTLIAMFVGSIGGLIVLALISIIADQSIPPAGSAAIANIVAVCVLTAVVSATAMPWVSKAQSLGSLRTE